MIRAMGFNSTNVFFHEKTCGLVFELGSVCVSVRLGVQTMCFKCVHVPHVLLCWLVETACMCISVSFSMSERVLCYLCVCM